MLSLIALPFISSMILFFFPRGLSKYLRPISILLGIIPLVLLVFGRWLGQEIDVPWLPALNIRFHLQIDVLSLVFLYLTALIIPISLTLIEGPPFFYGLVLLLQGLLFGFFMARDLAVFTFFWEAILFPLYFMISFFGGKKATALKFLVYMIAGSSLMVLAVLALYFQAALILGQGTLDLDTLSTISETSAYAPWIFAIFILAFAVKTPLFPFHGWLAETYYQAPLAGTILLSALLSKAGIYGMARIGLGLFPSFMQQYSPLLVVLAIIGVLYGGLIAWREQDFKRLVAYSSFSHVNFVLVGLFVAGSVAKTGAIFQALNHGVTITALFLAVGWLQERLGSTRIGQASGLAKTFPTLCWVTLFFVLSSVALPGLNNFVGEVLILFGLFAISPWLAFILGLSIILSVMYMLRWMQKMYFEEPRTQEVVLSTDLRKKEMLLALPLIGLILWMGIYPAILLQPLKEQMVSFEKMEDRR